MNWGFGLGMLLGIFAAVFSLIASDDGRSVGDVLYWFLALAVASPFLGCMAALFGYCLGTLLEAFVKSIAGRPKGMGAALAAHGKEAGQTLAKRERLRKLSAEDSFRPAAHVTPPSVPPEEQTGIATEVRPDDPQ
ncbi:MAG TPA: hypothetical protein VJ739_11700 [Gemmataceae bacterium]|nr:hypothetical protein [Gemmataceae bacterium]